MTSMGVTVVLTSILILTVATFAFMGYSPSSLFQIAFAQIPDTGSNPDPGTMDPSASSGLPGDNSTDLGSASMDPSAGSGLPGDNSTDLGSASMDPSTGLGIPGDNSTNVPMQLSNETSSAAVPEFGPLVSVVLVFSTLSIMLLSTRTRLRF